jgi:hypothetical protein
MAMLPTEQARRQQSHGSMRSQVGVMLLFRIRAWQGRGDFD